MSTQDLGQYNEAVRQNGVRLNSNEPLVAAGTVTMSGTETHTGSVSYTQAVSASGGQNQAGANQSTVFHSGGIQPAGALTTNYHQTQFVSTDSYFCEVFIPDNATITGISVLNGHTTSASQDTFVGLANSAGTIVASSNTTTAQATADTYQQIPFSAPYSAIGPSKYYIVVQGSNTTGYLATHTIGNFGAALKTSETYGTFVTTASYSTTTFTASNGPIADTY